MSEGADESRTIMVEFGPLSDEQRHLIDLHSLRAVGTGTPQLTNGRVIVEFWLRDGEIAVETYDDIRGWAIGHGLPVGGLVEN